MNSRKNLMLISDFEYLVTKYYHHSTNITFYHQKFNISVTCRILTTNMDICVEDPMATPIVISCGRFNFINQLSAQKRGCRYASLRKTYKLVLHGEHNGTCVLCSVSYNRKKNDTYESHWHVQ